MIAVELTVGRHSVRDGAGIDPIVVAALTSQRAPAEPGSLRHDLAPRRPDRAAADGEDGLGWPGDPADGTGLGWPGDLRTPDDRGDDDRGNAAPVAEPLAEEPPARRGAWRRIFGGRAA